MTKRSQKAWKKWRKLVSEHERSGQTSAVFCRERGLCRPYFFAWKKRLREDPAMKFLEVQLRDAAPSPTRERDMVPPRSAKSEFSK